MQTPERLREQICGEAADWFVRLQEEAPEALTSAERDEFAQWLLRSPAHLEEYLAVTRSWGDLAAIDDVDLTPLIATARAEELPANVVTLAGGRKEQAASSRSTWRRYAYAAVAFVLVAA